MQIQLVIATKTKLLYIMQCIQEIVNAEQGLAMKQK